MSLAILAVLAHVEEGDLLAIGQPLAEHRHVDAGYCRWFRAHGRS
jgi:hypothetical protein